MCVYIYIYIYIYTHIYIYLFIYTYMPSKIQPEDGCKKPKHVAESCKFIEYLIKCWLIYILLHYLLNRKKYNGMPCLKIEWVQILPSL